MRIAHCQFEPKSGNFDANLARMLEGIEKAQEAQAEIVSFPECFLTGYQNDAGRARRHAFSADSPEMKAVLEVTCGVDPTVIVGFNERRDKDLYNSALVAHGGRALGIYSKCSAYMPFHSQGREFPVFERETRDNGRVKFGVLICSDGGYIEPARILALKGARVVFAPHYNYIEPSRLIEHFMKVRADHVARAIENRIYFVRGNNVTLGKEQSIRGIDGVGYGDSYVVDPMGEILVRSRRHVEDLLLAEIHPNDTGHGHSGQADRSLWSAREFGPALAELTREIELRRQESD